MFQPNFPLTVSTIKSAYQAGLAAIEGGQTTFDLAAVTSVDSAAVAAMVGWRRAALQRGAALAFTNLPDALQSLIELYGVSAALQCGDLHH